MTQLTAADGNTYRLISAHEFTADAVALEFLDQHHAFRFLTDLADIGANREYLRSFADGNLFLHDLRGFTENDLWQRLAEGLVSGRWYLASAEGRRRRVSFGGRKPEGSSEPEEEEEEDEQEEEAPPPAKDELTWVKFAFVDDETGEPVKGVTLKVTLPDGETKIGKSDAAGIVEFKDIPAGSCKIEKMLDNDTLEVVAVE